MIYKSGKPVIRSSTGASESEIRAIVESSNESLAERILAMIAGMPARTVIAGQEGGMADQLDGETLSRLATMMAQSAGSEKSNFGSLGTEQKVVGDKGKDENTIRMLEDLPE